MCVLSTFPGQRQLAEEAASTKAEPPSLKSATSLDHAAEEARCTAAVAEVVKAAHRPSNFAVAIQNLCLGSRGLTRLGGLSRLVCLRFLSLNCNALSSLDGLECCTRLTRVEAAHNLITRLSDSPLARLTCLEALDLSYNKLDDLQDILRACRKWRSLRSLSLEGNPCVAKAGWRRRLIAALPSLLVLNNRRVVRPPVQTLHAPVVFGSRLRVQRSTAPVNRGNEELLIAEVEQREFDKLLQDLAADAAFANGERLDGTPPTPQRVRRAARDVLPLVRNRYVIL